jgi:hypothetical protein
VEKYSPEEVKQLIAMLKVINSQTKKPKGLEPSRLEKQIKYLEQRYNFFNPTKEMLRYIIGQAEKSKPKLDSVLLQKLKDEFSKKLD